MVINLTPQQEETIKAALTSGTIPSVEAWFESAIAAIPKPLDPELIALRKKSLVELFEPVRGLFTDEELAMMFERRR